MTMLIKHICPVCNVHHATFEHANKDREGVGELTICCPACHAERQAKIATLNAMYPSSDELGLLGSITEIPTERFVRPHQRGKQINHKSEHRAG